MVRNWAASAIEKKNENILRRLWQAVTSKLLGRTLNGLSSRLCFHQAAVTGKGTEASVSQFILSARNCSVNRREMKQNVVLY